MSSSVLFVQFGSTGNHSLVVLLCFSVQFLLWSSLVLLCKEPQFSLLLLTQSLVSFSFVFACFVKLVLPQFYSLYLFCSTGTGATTVQFIYKHRGVYWPLWLSKEVQFLIAGRKGATEKTANGCTSVQLKDDNKKLFV